MLLVMHGLCVIVSRLWRVSTWHQRTTEAGHK